MGADQVQSKARAGNSKAQVRIIIMPSHTRNGVTSDTCWPGGDDAHTVDEGLLETGPMPPWWAPPPTFRGSGQPAAAWRTTALIRINGQTHQGHYRPRTARCNLIILPCTHHCE